MALTVRATPPRETGGGDVPTVIVQADAMWRDALARASAEKKMLVVFFRESACTRCEAFEQGALHHPAIVRRLDGVVFLTLPSDAGAGARLWAAEGSGVGLFDRSATLRARWRAIPDTTNFGVILDSAVAVGPQFERAVHLAENGSSGEAEIHAAAGLHMLERRVEARAALERARKSGRAEVRQSADVTEALFDLDAGTADLRTVTRLEKIAAGAARPEIAADAWMVAGMIHRAKGSTALALRAFESAHRIAPAGTGPHTAAQEAIDELRSASADESQVIRILPLERQVVRGRQTVRTKVGTIAVARVVFSLDGREVAHVRRPPFSGSIDFGSLPERRTIRVVAYGRNGSEVGRDERIVNDAGELFRVRITSPREGPAEERVRVAMDVRVPPQRKVNRVTVYWNEAQRAVLTSPPWECVIALDDATAGAIGVLRAVAELDDARISEDSVLLNAGLAEHANVHLVELPITVIATPGATLPVVVRDSVTVTEEGRRRPVEAIATPAETALTVGVLLDVSASMQRTLPDLQEAASRFLATALGPRDRAFLIPFDTRARLVQPATSDLALLRRRIMKFRPGGLTALYDAMALGLLQFEGVKGRRALVVFTDGLDRTSESTASEVMELARRSNVPIHFIASVPGVAATANTPAAPAGNGPHRELSFLARATGGTAHTLRELSELPTVFAHIEERLGSQFLVFVRTDPASRENEWRRITVRVEGADALAPEGYFASW